MPPTPRRRKLYRQTKRLLIRRYLKWYRETALWDDSKLLFMPRILDTPELIIAASQVQAALLNKLTLLEPLPGEAPP
jgi:hypothetical protein